MWEKAAEREFQNQNFSRWLLESCIWGLKNDASCVIVTQVPFLAYVWPGIACTLARDEVYVAVLQYFFHLLKKAAEACGQCLPSQIQTPSFQPNFAFFCLFNSSLLGSNWGKGLVRLQIFIICISNFLPLLAALCQFSKISCLMFSLIILEKNARPIFFFYYFNHNEKMGKKKLL